MIHRTVSPDGKAKALILLKKTVEVPVEGGTFNSVTERSVPE